MLQLILNISWLQAVCVTRRIWVRKLIDLTEILSQKYQLVIFLSFTFEKKKQRIKYAFKL